MSGKRIPSRNVGPTPEETAELLEEVAERLTTGDRSVELQVPLSAIATGLLLVQNIEGATLINRIGLQLLHEQGYSTRYAGTALMRRQLAKLPPVDFARDAADLRTIANGLRDRG